MIYGEKHGIKELRCWTYLLVDAIETKKAKNELLDRVFRGLAASLVLCICF
jgi:hypothetical protein